MFKKIPVLILTLFLFSIAILSLYIGIKIDPMAFIVAAWFGLGTYYSIKLLKE